MFIEILFYISIYSCAHALINLFIIASPKPVVSTPSIIIKSALYVSAFLKNAKMLWLISSRVFPKASLCSALYFSLFPCSA